MTNQIERIGSEEDRERRRLKAFSNSIRCAAPGIVTAVNLTAQTCTVKLALQARYSDETGTETWTDLPLLQDVPIVWPRAGGYALTFPVKAGDECLVVFGDQCIDAWWQSGGTQKPMDDRRHDLSDGFAVFGCTSQPRKLPSVSSSAVELRTEDRSNYLSLTKGTLTINITGKTTLNCPSTEITGDVLIDKTLTVKGLITGQGGFNISGGSGATASVTGNIKTTGDVVAGGISLQGHTHTGDSGGTTSAPKT